MQYDGRVYLDKATRYVLMRFEDLNIPETEKVMLILFHAPNGESAGAINETPSVNTVKADGSANFLLRFLPHFKEVGCPRHTVDVPTDSTACATMPHIAYALRHESGRAIMRGCLSVHTVWMDMIKDMCGTFCREIDDAPVSHSTAFRGLSEKWSALFKKIADAPAFNQTLYCDLVAVALDKELPAGTMGSDFDSRDDLLAVFQTFHAFADMLGRSKIMRHLYTFNQLLLLPQSARVVFADESLKGPATRLFLRLATRNIEKPAVTAQLVKIDASGAHKFFSWTVSITSSGLTNGFGDPMVAFARLAPEKYVDLFKGLTYAAVLSATKSENTFSFYSSPSRRSASFEWNYNNLQWWSSDALQIQ